MISCRPVGVSPQLPCSASSSPASPFSFTHIVLLLRQEQAPPALAHSMTRRSTANPTTSHSAAIALPALAPPARSKIASPTWLREPKVKLSEPICHGRCFL